jgi:hypothetical protein
MGSATGLVSAGHVCGYGRAKGRPGAGCPRAIVADPAGAPLTADAAPVRI